MWFVGFEKLYEHFNELNKVESIKRMHNSTVKTEYNYKYTVRDLKGLKFNWFYS